MSAARRKVELDAVAERCQSLKLVHAAECLDELVEEASREDLSPVKFLDRVLEREIERKDEPRIATSPRLSGLPVGRPSRASTGPSSPASIAPSSKPWPPAPSCARLTTCPS